MSYCELTSGPLSDFVSERVSGGKFFGNREGMLYINRKA